MASKFFDTSDSELSEAESVISVISEKSAKKMKLIESDNEKEIEEIKKDVNVEVSYFCR